MYPASFEYLIPKDLKDATALLGRYGNTAKLLAGGQSLVPMMKLRLARPKYLIDLNRLPGLSYIKESNGFVHCGAMTRHFVFEKSPLINEKLPLIAEAATHIADAQVRNRGTLGGALAQADPSGDWGPVILALNARLKCVGLEGERVIEAKDFFSFAYTTALQDNEILAEVAFPLQEKATCGVFLKLEKVSGDFAIVSVALQLGVDQNNVCRAIGIGLGGAGITPIKPDSVEHFLLGKPMTADLIEQAARMISEQASPIDDLKGSADYKKKVLKVLFNRAVATALQKPQ
ncbi:MAG: xanthine dehydrogenase family protein subunit M [Deltaproteobacteria bacterium]|nr:xanthine dehydrogenase family protein subunit M [Deltaproteobacteria bacterium]